MSIRNEGEFEYRGQSHRHFEAIYRSVWILGGLWRHLIEGFGLPMPGEAMLITASLLASQGDIFIPWLLITAGNSQMSNRNYCRAKTEGGNNVITMDISVNADVVCGDGPCGSSICVIVNPTTW